MVFMFKHCGQFIFAPGTSEEHVMDVALDNGADDVQTYEEGVIEVTCEPGDYATLKQAFDAAGLQAEIHGVVMKALSKVQLAGEDAERMQKIIDLLKDLDDVQEVFTTAALDETE